MPTAKAQLVGNGLSLKNGGPLQYYVDGIDATDPIAWSVQALTAGGLPQIGDSFAPFGYVLDVAITGQSEGQPNSTMVTVTVGREEEEDGGGGAGPNETIVEFDSYTAQIVTSKDYGGENIMVIYNPDDAGDKQPDPTPSTGDDGMAAEVSAFEAIRVCRVSRQETDAQKIIDLQQTHVNHTNAATFAGVDPEGWLCTRIAASLRVVSGELVTPFGVNYEFQCMENGWQRAARYLLPESGDAPTKNVPAFKAPLFSENIPRVRLQPGNPFEDQHRKNGYTIVRVQGMVDFNEFNFPLGITT